MALPKHETFCGYVGQFFDHLSVQHLSDQHIKSKLGIGTQDTRIDLERIPIRILYDDLKRCYVKIIKHFSTLTSVGHEILVPLCLSAVAVWLSI